MAPGGERKQPGHEVLWRLPIRCVNVGTKYTSKQMGDACEMLVAAELTLAGVPALNVPDNRPGYDVIAQPIGGGMPQKISVKSRTYRRRGGGHTAAYSVTDY